MTHLHDAGPSIAWRQHSLHYVSQKLLSVTDGTASQHQDILQRGLPEDLKLSIARKIENHLFSKVLPGPSSQNHALNLGTLVIMPSSAPVTVRAVRAVYCCADFMLFDTFLYSSRALCNALAYIKAFDRFITVPGEC